MGLDDPTGVPGRGAAYVVDTTEAAGCGLEDAAPVRLRVIRRDGKIVPFDANKINIALAKAFLAAEGDCAPASSRVRETIDEIASRVVEAVRHRLALGAPIHLEAIQDQVELALTRAGEHHVARAYVSQRDRRRDASVGSDSGLRMTLADGRVIPLDEPRIRRVVAEACAGLAGTEPERVYGTVMRSLFDGVAEHEAAKAMVVSACMLIEREPAYTYVAARLLLDALRSEALTFVEGRLEAATQREMAQRYHSYFHAYVKRALELELMDSRLGNLDLDRLGRAIRPERDFQFTYTGIRTLYDHCCLQHAGTRFELPQALFMRVAMGLAVNESDAEAWAVRFYDVLSSFDFMSSTPMLRNAGTLGAQLSPCYLSTVPDDLDGIFGAIHDNALVARFAAGLGNDWTQVRGSGACIKSTNATSRGIVPFLKVANDAALAIDQGGRGEGAVCAYLETWHRDIEEFVELRKPTGDPRRRTPDMHTANWVPDLFMKRVCDEGDWTLFSPDDAPDLHDLFGTAFEQRYLAYEASAERGEIGNVEKLRAVDLWRKMLGMLYETGHPWISFKDAINLRSPQRHAGVVHGSSPCTGVTLNTAATVEVAACHLGSVNLARHLDGDDIDLAKLERTVGVAMRMLDNAIDCSCYSVPAARASSQRHRPVGLGVMAFQDCLYSLRLAYASEEAVDFADRSMEAVSYFAIQASADLAAERGAYPSFDGSLWSRGLLPLDSIALLEQGRGGYVDVDRTATLDWDRVRKRVRAVGMRNSHCTAVAPMAAISDICGVGPSIEPAYGNVSVKSDGWGEFTVVNRHLANDLKRCGLWDPVMLNDLKYYAGSIRHIDRIPMSLKRLYATASETDPRWLVEAAARRQKWLDQAQALNLYLAEPDGFKLDKLYKLAWVRGLKTTCCLHARGPTHPEQRKVVEGSSNTGRSAGPDEDPPNVCYLSAPDCEPCQ